MFTLAFAFALIVAPHDTEVSPSDPQKDPRFGERIVAALGSGSWFIGLPSLDPKIMPFAVEDDEDGKDIKVKGRARFKPHTPEDAPNLKKRLRMKSKRDGGRACVLAEHAAAGNVSTQMRVAVDATKGLSDDVSCAFYEMRVEAAEDAPTCLRVEAVWNEDIGGFTARATENGTPVGVSADYPGETELLLHVERLDGVVTLAVTSLESFDMQVLHTTGGEDGAESSFLGGFGVEGLDKGGSMYFADTSISGNPDDVELTDEEEVLAFRLWLAGESSGLAEFFAEPDFGDANIPLAASSIAGAASYFAQARTTLDGLISDGIVAGKRAKLLAATIKKGLKKTQAGAALGAKLVEQGKLTKPNGKLEKLAERGRNYGQMGTGQLYGFASSGISKFYNSVDF